jgi:hypothetical protein
MRYALISTLVICALAAQGLSQAPTSDQPATAHRKIACKTPENAATCYWTHGRLSFYEGDPSWRIWKIGTKRILAIYSGASIYESTPTIRERDGENPEMPINLDALFEANYKHQMVTHDRYASVPDSAYGDFEICPLEPEHSGWMQAACIESAKNIVLQNYVPRY